uniref:Uncharacterized protein n=1 Tax=Anguilla anguilla TaxID=7936 RepID=A0A0E9TH10_ANGAN
MGQRHGARGLERDGSEGQRETGQRHRSERGVRETGQRHG